MQGWGYHKADNINTKGVDIVKIIRAGDRNRAITTKIYLFIVVKKTTPNTIKIREHHVIHIPDKRNPIVRRVDQNSKMEKFGVSIIIF